MRLPLAVALRSPVVVVRLRMTTHGIRPARALPDVVGGRAPPTEKSDEVKHFHNFHGAASHKKNNHDERVEARDLIMAKKPNTGKHECVEARDLIIAKRPRRRSAHLNDTPQCPARGLEPRPLEDMTP